MIKSTIAFIGVLVGSIIIFVGLIAAGWWYYEYSINKDAQIQRSGFNFQETARDELVDQSAVLADIDTQLSNPALTPDQKQVLVTQRNAVATQLCNIAADLTGDLSPIHQEIINKECF